MVSIGCFLYYGISSPEYALKIIIEDVDSEGISGLKKHLTADTLERFEKVENIIDCSNKTVVTDIISSMSKEYLIDKMTEIDWSVEDILKGKNRTYVVIGFNYEDNIIGTIDIIMIREKSQWKVDSFSIPHIVKCE